MQASQHWLFVVSGLGGLWRQLPAPLARNGHFRRRWSINGRDGLCAVPLIISNSISQEKNGTARRLSLPSPKQNVLAGRC